MEPDIQADTLTADPAIVTLVGQLVIDWNRGHARRMRMTPSALALFLLLCTEQATALPRPMLTHVGPANGQGLRSVEATVLNEGDFAEVFLVPPSLGAVLRDSGGNVDLVLERSPGSPSSVTIPAGGFAKLSFRVILPAGTSSSNPSLTVADWGPDGLAFAGDPPSSAAPTPAPPVTSLAQTYAAPVRYETRYQSSDGDHGNAFLPNLTVYEPVYAVYGPGTDTDARLQVSFKYQLFGDARVGRTSWIDDIHFAFTQRLYWNLGAESSPFRNVDYMPELFYLLPATPLTSTVTLGGQAGFRHESNGRSGLASRSFNTVYIQPVASLPIGRFKLSVGPRVWAYAGSLEDNPDVRRYRGNTGVFAEIGSDDGWRLTTTSRFDFGTGRGAIDGLVSYPLDRLISRNLKLYAFGQGFAGYGENLLDYNRRTTRLRVGIGLVR